MVALIHQHEVKQVVGWHGHSGNLRAGGVRCADHHVEGLASLHALGGIDAPHRLDRHANAAARLVGVQPGTRGAQLVEGLGDELLPAEAGVDAHQQHHVELVHDVVHPVERGGRVEHQAGLTAGVADQPERAVDVLGGLGVEGDDVGAGLGEVGHDAIDRLHHQVHVDRRRGVRADGLAHQRADGEVGDVVVVHHVEVNPVGAGGDDVANLLAEAGEVGGQQAGGDAVHGGLRCGWQRGF